MNYKKMIKQATVLTFASTLLVGGAAETFAKGNNNSNNSSNSSKPNNNWNKVIYNDYGFSHITRADMLKIPNQQFNKKFQVPTFNEIGRAHV